MRIFSFWQHRRILFLISLPATPEFQVCRAEVDQCIARLKRQKVDVCTAINPSSLSQISQYEAVIVVAHRNEQTDSLVLADGELTISDFVNALAADFAGVLDFSSCYAATAMSRIKARCPQCKVLAPMAQTTLSLRLIMYPYLVQLLNEDKNRTYRDTYEEVLREIAAEMFERDNSKRLEQEDTMTEAMPQAENTPVKLGAQQSSIYAPTCVKKETPFLVQVFLHHDNEGQVVAIEARQADSNASLRESTVLPIKLKKKDRIAIRLSFRSPEKDRITIEDDIDTKQVIWLGQKTKVTFCVTVEEAFSGDSFVGKLMLEVNSMPVGESYFTIQVDKKENVAPAAVHLVPHDYQAEQKEAKAVLLDKLNENLYQLQKELASAKDAAEQERLQRAIQVCTSCIEVLNNPARTANPSVKKVFVSSTSDMKPYREIIRKEIEICNMFPEMYENWPQTDATPKEECCRRVINSDVFFCILGATYGFVEPTLGISMTEFEYRTALEAGKPILVCIIDPLNQTDEPHDKKVRQQQLIEEIKNTRILKFFSDGATLAQNAARDLSRL